MRRTILAALVVVLSVFIGREAYSVFDPSCPGYFYGINGHWVQGGPNTSVSLAAQKAVLNDLGVTLFRQDMYSVANAQTLANNATTIGPQIKICPVIIPAAASTYADETAAFNAGFTLGQGSAQALVGKVDMYELGNEQEIPCALGGVDGADPGDYDNTCFVKTRGAMRGILAGIKSADTAAKILFGSGGWVHFGFPTMMWNGTTPSNGTPDVTKQLRWDISVVHWYSDFGSILSAGGYNVLQEHKTRFGVPITINEFNTRPSLGTEQQEADYLTNTMLPEFDNARVQYNIVGLVLYQLYTDGEGSYGVIQADGVTQNPRYAAYKNWIAGHIDRP